MPSSLRNPSDEDAVRSLERAHIRKNVEAAVACKDFLEEARLTLSNLHPEDAKDKQTVREAAKVLELAFRQELKTKGFPNFKELKCSFSRKEEISPTLVKLTEECLFPDGGKSREDVHVRKSSVGWRVVILPD